MALKSIWNITAVDAASIPVKSIATAAKQLEDNLSSLKNTTVKVNLAMGKAAEKAKGFTASLNATAVASMRMGRTLSLYVAGPLIALGGLAIKTASDFEKIQRSAEIVSGSVEGTAKMFDTLYEAAQKMPFAYKDIITSSRNLLVAGVIPKEIPHMMQMLADLAGAFGDKLSTVADILTHVEAVGRLNTNTARRFAKEGINLAAAYKKVYHVDTMKNATAWFEMAARAGIVTSKVVVQLLDSMTKKGGPAYLGAAKMSKTLSGAITILRSNIVVLLKNIGDWIDKSNDLRLMVASLADTVFHATTWLVEFAKTHKTLMRIAVDLGVALATLASGLLILGGVLKVVGVVVKLYTVLTKAWAAAQIILDVALAPEILVLLALAAAVYVVYKAVKKLQSVWGKGSKEEQKRVLIHKQQVEFVKEHIPELHTFRTPGMRFSPISPISFLPVPTETTSPITSNLMTTLTPHFGVARARSDVNINLRGETGAVKSVHTVHSMIHPGFNLGVNMEEAQ